MDPKWQLSEKKKPPGRIYDKAVRKRDPRRNRNHLVFIRSLPCAVLAHPLPGTTPCQWAIEAHHPTGAGTALKAPDRRAIPLCMHHHLECLHRFAGPFVGWSKERLHRWETIMSDTYERLGALRTEIEQGTE